MRLDERAALIATIREAPDDDAPRLVFADWLEERGDEANLARAEFIRIQITRANLPVADGRHSELQARELRLLKRWARVWCGAHFAFRKVRFRRGFIEFVHLHLTHWLHHRRQLLALEPVRDVRLTGWFRASEDLVRRVAACEEWRDVETLRLHHQGPHKDPPGRVVTLLESPHLTRLRALHVPSLSCTAEERRRFERLPVLRQLRELQLPYVDSYPHNPGDWFSDGGGHDAAGWGELTSLRLPYFLRLGCLRQLTEMPSWGRLRALELVDLPHPQAEALALLAQHLPPQLEDFRLVCGYNSEDVGQGGPLFDSLSQAPLRALHFDGLTGAGPHLSHLLTRPNRWAIEHLSLRRCGLTEHHARALAETPWAGGLHYLDLSGHHQTQIAATRTLFSSGALRSLVHLDVAGTPVGGAGATALASAQAAPRLRSLSLYGTGVGAEDLRDLLRTEAFQGLNWLTLGEHSYGQGRGLTVTSDLAVALAQLPHLAALELSATHLEDGARSDLGQAPGLAWLTVPAEARLDIQGERAACSPDRLIPLDPALDPPRGR